MHVRMWFLVKTLNSDDRRLTPFGYEQSEQLELALKRNWEGVMVEVWNGRAGRLCLVRLLSAATARV